MPALHAPVFISYARAASADRAKELLAALGPNRAFLDTEDIPFGAKFPDRIGQALLRARVVVLFVEPQYFESAFCLAEMRLALCVGRAHEYPHVVVAIPEDSEACKFAVENLPWPLGQISWPKHSQITELAALVEQRLGQNRGSLENRDPAHAEAELKAVTSVLLIPPPGRFGHIPHFALSGIPNSIGNQFVGREAEICKLHNELTARPAATAALSSALGGAAGFGKTRFAIEYLNRFGPRHYPGGVFWLNAESGDLELQFQGMLSELDSNAPDLNSLQKDRGVAHALARAFEKIEKKRILFVADNIPEGDGRSMDFWCPGKGHVTFLATSRGSIEGLDSTLLVGELPTDAARQLLTRELAEASSRSADWDVVCQWVGHHPLALEILNGSLRHGGATLDELLAASQRSGPVRTVDSKFKALAQSSLSGFVQQGIEAALRISYDKLTPEAQSATHLIARLAPEPIPLVLLQQLVKEQALDAVRVILRSRNWVVGDSNASGEVFGRMHRLLSDFLRSTTSPEDETEQWVTLCLALNSVLGLDECRDARLWKDFNLFLPHADHIFDCLFDVGVGPRPFPYWRAVVELGLKSGLLKLTQGFASTASHHEERTLELARQQLGPNHPDTLAAMSNLAETQRARGDLAETCRTQKELLDACLREFGAEDPYTLSSMNNLAATFLEIGNLEEGRKLGEALLALCRRILGDEDPNTLTAMHNFASTLKALGDSAGARSIQARVLEVRRRVLGAKAPDTLASANNLALTLFDEGDLPGARGLHEEVLEAFRHDLRAKHQYTSQAACNLFLTLDKMGERDAAQALLDRDLLWLLDCDPSDLGVMLRKIHEQVKKVKGYRLTRKP